MPKLFVLYLSLVPLSAGVIFDTSFAVPSGTLPPGWFSVVAEGSGAPFVVTGTGEWGFALATASAFAEIQLYSPLYYVTEFPSLLTINHGVSGAYDPNGGAVLEISVNGDSYRDVLDVGATFLSGGYNAEIDASSPNPLLRGNGFRKVWSGDSFLTSTVEFARLPIPVPASIQFRYSIGSGSANGVQYGQFFWAQASDASPTPTPEPSSAILTAASLLLLFRRRFRLPTPRAQTIMPKLFVLYLSLVPLSAGVIFDTSFDVPVGTLPTGWFSVIAEGTGIRFASLGGDGAFAFGAAEGFGEVQLYSPIFYVAEFPSVLTIHHATGSGADLNGGAVLEISLNGGAYQDVLDTGATFLGGGYNAEIDSSTPNPLLRGASFRKVWRNLGSAISTVEFDRLPIAVPASIQFRYSIGGGSASSYQSVRFYRAEASDASPTPTPEPSCAILTAASLLLLFRRRFRLPTPRAQTVMPKLFLLSLSLLPLSAGVIFDTSFDGAEGTLPPGWFSVVAEGSGTPFASDGLSAYAAATDFAEIQLYSPLFYVAEFPFRLTLYHGVTGVADPNGGAVLEISVNGGLYRDVLDVGATFLVNGYNAEIDDGTPNPLLRGDSFRKVWRANPPAQSMVEFDRLSVAVPASIQLRYSIGSGSVSGLQGAAIFSALASDASPTPTPEPSCAILTAASLLLLFRRRVRGSGVKLRLHPDGR